MQERNALGASIAGALLSNATLALGSLLLQNLSLVHRHAANDIGVESLDLQLRRLGHPLLLADNLVDLGQVALNLGAVAVFAHLSTGRHLLDVMFEFAHSRARDLCIAQVALSIDGGLGTGRVRDILVGGRHVQGLLAVLDELGTQLLGQLIGITTFRRAVVDVVLHELEQEGVGPVHDRNASGDDLTVHKLQTSKNDVVEHGQRILSHPVPVGVVDTRFQGSKRRLDTGGIKLAVFHIPQIQLRLQDLVRLLGSKELPVSFPQVHLEVSGQELKLLLEQRFLVLGQGIQRSRVHHHASAATSSSTTSRRSRQRDASSGGVFVRNTVQESLSVRLTAQSCCRLHGNSQKQNTILSARRQTPPVGQVLAHRRDVETSGHFTGNHSSDKRARLLAQLSVECGLERASQLVQRDIFGLLGCGAEFLL
jgi:hypothetical protein